MKELACTTKQKSLNTNHFLIVLIMYLDLKVCVRVVHMCILLSKSGGGKLDVRKNFARQSKVRVLFRNLPYPLLRLDFAGLSVPESKQAVNTWSNRSCSLRKKKRIRRREHQQRIIILLPLKYTKTFARRKGRLPKITHTVYCKKRSPILFRYHL